MIQLNLAFAIKGNGSLQTPILKEDVSMKLGNIKMIIEIILGSLKVFDWFKKAFKNKKPKSKKKSRRSARKS